jgi:hypothetical protein
MAVPFDHCRRLSAKCDVQGVHTPSDAEHRKSAFYRLQQGIRHGFRIGKCSSPGNHQSTDIRWERTCTGIAN